MGIFKKMYNKITGNTAYNNETYVKPAKLLNETHVLRQHGLTPHKYVKNIEYSAMCQGCVFSDKSKSIDLVLTDYTPQFLMNSRIEKAKETAKLARCKKYGEVAVQEIKKVPNNTDVYVSGEKHELHFGAGDRPVGKILVISNYSDRLAEAGLTELIKDAKCAQHTACQMKFVDKWGYDSPTETQYLDNGVILAKRAGTEYSQEEFKDLEVMGWLKGFKPKKVSAKLHSMARDFVGKLEQVAVVRKTKDKVYKLFLGDANGTATNTEGYNAPEFEEGTMRRPAPQPVEQETVEDIIEDEQADANEDAATEQPSEPREPVKSENGELTSQDL